MINIIFIFVKYFLGKMSSYIFEHPECEWDYDRLSANPIISLEYIENHPEIEWNYSLLSQNHSICYDPHPYVLK